jgi:hypothetical protein
MPDASVQGRAGDPDFEYGQEIKAKLGRKGPVEAICVLATHGG